MTVTIEHLKDTFKIGYEAYEISKNEAKEIWELYHNKQYTDDQLNVLANRGQPAETFNVIKLFSNLLIGYYSTINNKIKSLPVGYEDIQTSSVINDTLDYIQRDNNFVEESEKIKLCGLISGMLCSYVEVTPTDKKDQFGRVINKCVLEYVPESEIILDPMARRTDYTDARFIHRFKWMSEEALTNMFGASAADKITEYYNFTLTEAGDYENFQQQQFTGVYKMHKNYLVVHSIVVDDNGDSWSTYWHDDVKLKQDKITHKDVKFPYRITLVNVTDSGSEYYGIFREVAESQKAINQALIKLQLLVNTQRVFVQQNAVDDIDEFTDSFNRVTNVIQVKALKGLQVENLSREAQDQYVVIDKSLDRIQRILGINDSFLGMAYASDSRRKVKLQQNATVIALRYFTSKIETFYRLLGWDMVNLIKQYYTATQVIRVSDELSGQRWATLNQPETIWSGQLDEQGQPIMEYQFEEVLDPASGDPVIDESGNRVFAPIPTKDTEVSASSVDLEIQATAYNDEDEKNQLMLETVLAGSTGQLLAKVNPAGYFRAAGLSMLSVKTKNSPEIAEIFLSTSQMLDQNQQAQQEASLMAQGGSQAKSQPKSQELKLPQNTNGQ